MNRGTLEGVLPEEVARRARETATRVLVCCVACVGLPACGQRMVGGPLRPAGQAEQGAAMQVLDDGTVVFKRGRFEMALRPMADEELNRRFAPATERGVNPYTYSRWKPIGRPQPPKRFQVFLLRVKNYEFPKVRVVPGRMWMESGNDRIYHTLSLAELRDYYIKYAVGYSGNKYNAFKQRKDLLRQTLFPEDEMLFSGMEADGYVVFPKLANDVRDVTVHMDDVEVRFNAWEEPIETIDVTFRFERSIVPLVDAERQQSHATRSP